MVPRRAQRRTTLGILSWGLSLSRYLGRELLPDLIHEVLDVPAGVELSVVAGFSFVESLSCFSFQPGEPGFVFLLALLQKT